MTLLGFLVGVFAITFAASGVFFLKFWKESRDSFFLYFAIACFLFFFERIVVISLDSSYNLLGSSSEELAWVYLLRLSAFAVILAAILKKNFVRS